MRSSFDFKQYDVGSPWGLTDYSPHREIEDDPPIMKRPDKKFVPPPEANKTGYITIATLPGIPLCWR